MRDLQLLTLAAFLLGLAVYLVGVAEVVTRRGQDETLPVTVACFLLVLAALVVQEATGLAIPLPF